MEPQKLLGNRIGVVLASPSGQYFPFSVRLGFDCTNNMAECEACAVGITMAIEHQVGKLRVFGDSALFIYQLRGEWETRDAKLIPYHAHITTLAEQFEEISFHYVPRDENQMANALATLPGQRNDHTVEIDGKPWYYDIKGYLKKGEHPLGPTENDKRTLRRMATSFFLSEVVLYKRSTDSTFLRSVDG
ncbi:hypothetical protein CR513_59164, partial [Mucuna pruriens]